jgi:hypothetical protein
MTFLGNKGWMLRVSTGVLALFLCSSILRADFIPENRIIVSVRDQKLMLLQNGSKIATYPVSTSKYGLGDNLGTMTTPLGLLQVAQKIGDNAPPGAVFHNRHRTGEILRPNAPGRDPIVTRIIWLRGLEASNAHAFNRCIYIHGTPEERRIGRPASYGCIRMRSSDVAALYNQIPIGTFVQIVPDRLPKVSKTPAVRRALPVDEEQVAKGDWTTSARSPSKPAIPDKDALLARVSGRGA